MKSGLLACSFVAVATAAQAQTNHALPWFKIAGGGATTPSTGGVYALSGTIGQVDTGRVASTNDVFRLESGFWAIAIQQLGYPTLNITQSGTNAVVSWITAESGLILQQTADLATPTLWSNLGPAGLVSGTTNSVIVPRTPVQRQFFRLRRP
jgi:hypothetical protein